tara:strand:- start:818 stop:970 length:153 start_codon:yes stop_codon:yes gene_type:complete
MAQKIYIVQMTKNGASIEIEVPASSAKEAGEVAKRMYPDRNVFMTPKEKR